jgi:hypothetical protein
MPDLGDLGDGLSLGGCSAFVLFLAFLFISRYVVFIVLCLWKGEEDQRSL